MTAHQNLQAEMSRLLSQEKPSESLGGIGRALLSSLGTSRRPGRPFGDVMQERDQAFSSGIDQQIGRKIQIAELMMRQATLDASRGGLQGKNFNEALEIGKDLDVQGRAQLAQFLGTTQEEHEQKTGQQMSVSALSRMAGEFIQRENLEAPAKEFAPKSAQYKTLQLDPDKPASRVFWNVNDPEVQKRLKEYPKAVEVDLSLSDAEAGLTGDKEMARKVVASETATRNVISLGTTLIKALEDPNVVLGGAGATIGLFSGWAQQVKQIATSTGMIHETKGGEPLTIEEILDPNRYDFTGLEAVSEATSEVRANVIALAYMLAKQSDTAGRLSDFDVEQALKRLGLDRNNKKILALRVADAMRASTVSHNNFMLSLRKETVDFFPKTDGGGGGDAKPAPVTQESVDQESDEESLRQMLGP